MQKIQFDKDKYTFYAYLRKSTKKDTQETSIIRQNETIKYFINTYTNIDFNKDVIKFEEVWSAYQKITKLDKKGKVKEYLPTRKEFISLTESIFNNHQETWKRAILFIYNSSRLTRNDTDIKTIKAYLWITTENEEFRNRQIEEIYFVDNGTKWNYETSEDSIDNEVARNIKYSRTISMQNISRFKQDLERWKIPPDFALEKNTPFEYGYTNWVYKADKEKIKYLNRGLEKYYNGKITQKELFTYLKAHWIADIDYNGIKRYFNRPIFQGEYVDKKTDKVIPLKYDTFDGRIPIKQHLLDFIRQKKKRKAVSQKADFISSILKTVDWKKASFCIPWKNQWKKAIYYNFHNKPRQSIAFNSKLTNKKGFVQYVDDAELLNKLLFIYLKIYFLNEYNFLNNTVFQKSGNKNSFAYKQMIWCSKIFKLNYYNKWDKDDTKPLFRCIQICEADKKRDIMDELDNYFTEEEINSITDEEKRCVKIFQDYLYDAQCRWTYNLFYNFFLPYIDKSNEKEDIDLQKKNISRQIKELKEKAQEDLNFYKEVRDTENYIKTQKKLNKQIEELEEIKNNLQNEVIDFWDFQDFINVLEKIFNFLLNLDLSKVWTLTFSELINKNIITKSEFETILQNTIVEPILHPDYSLKIKLFDIFEELLKAKWCPEEDLNLHDYN